MDFTVPFNLSAAEGIQGYGAVQGPAVEIQDAQATGDFHGECPLPGGRVAVYGDDDIVHNHKSNKNMSIFAIHISNYHPP